MENRQTEVQTSAETAVSSTELITLTPVGVVRSEIKTPMPKADREGLSLEELKESAREHREKTKTLISRIIVDPDLTDILDGIEGFSHLLILYWPHLTPLLSKGLHKVHPMGRKDIPKQGIFATCSPARPNPVLVTAVRLVEREKNTLRVQGFEAVDGSPVLDIKPYNPGYYRVEDPTVPGWMKKLQEE